MDLANAFMKYLAGQEAAEEFGAMMEMSYNDEGEDEFADYYGLV